MDPHKPYTPYDTYSGPPSRNNMSAISSSMPPYNGHVAGASARRGNGNYSGNFGRGGYSSHGGMSRGAGGGGKRGGMASRGGHHRGPKPVHDQNNFLSYSSSSTPYQGGFQHHQQQQPIVPFHQRANEYNMDGGGISYPGPTVPDTTSYYHASTTPSRTTTTRKENFHWDAKRNDDADRVTQQIEQRAARERPCRTLFVRNVQYEARQSDVMNMFSHFGEIKDIFDLIEQRGMVFVTFYDLRAAEHAKQQTQGAELCGRKIDVHYSLPKEEDQNTKCGRSSNQGTLLFTLNNTKEWLQDDLLHPYFSQFGQVKVIRIPQFRNQSYGKRQRFVEYYDSRACIAAYDACQGQPYGDGIWDVSFFWDHTTKDKNDKPDYRGDTHASSTRYGAEKKRRLSDDDFQRSRRRRRNGPPQPPAPRDPRINHHRDTSSPSSNNRLAYGDTQLQSNEYNEERDRMEKAQKAQELLTKITQTPVTASPSSSLPSQSQPTMFNPQSTIPSQQLAYSMPTNLPAAAPAPTSQPATAQAASATPDQQAQLRELLDLLMVAQQQQQQQMQQQQQQATQPTIPVVPAVPTTTTTQPQAVPTDPNAALAQLAQALQSQQQAQQQGTLTSQPTAPSYGGGSGYSQYQQPGPGL
ncbi:protein mei2 [Lichtheimia corymbifera JMRC:FSU:9682]|uniref:Protein mei2 n=1 Tax=Lichtheimia corymbifera JMRC:FSU:9682 TaxID=1263082 RepID=A0A068RU62_9FUNG|nr:protein mei2 [Lichtheimia corymbifera JMRC:FSU:9682]